MKEECPKCKAEWFSISYSPWPGGNGHICNRCEFRWSINPYKEYGYLKTKFNCGAGEHDTLQEATHCGNHR